MAHVTLRFYEELNDYLSADRRKTPFEVPSQTDTTIGQLLENLKVPSSEVDLVLANGQSVDLSYVAHDGDRISIYPVFESVDISEVEKVHSSPLRRPAFVIDGRLGGLARNLRMLGFDAVHNSDYGGSDLLVISRMEERTILTKEGEPLKKLSVSRSYCVKSDDAREQVVEVLHRFDLADSAKPFTRCLACNRELPEAGRKAVLHRLSGKFGVFLREFRVCPFCHHVLWMGSRRGKLEEFVRSMTDSH